MGVRHHQGGDRAELGADGCKAIEELADHVPSHDGAERLWNPPSLQGIDEPNTAFIFRHHQDRARLVSHAGFQLFLDSGGNVFFHVSCTS